MDAAAAATKIFRRNHRCEALSVNFVATYFLRCTCESKKAASDVEKIAETQTSPALPGSHVDGDAETAPRKRKRENERDSAAVDLPSNTYNPVEEEEPMEDGKPKKESNGHQDIWNAFDMALENSKLDTPEDVPNIKEVSEKEVKIDCNHQIEIHEDLGHVCRICSMIVRKADMIFDFEWRKVSSRSRSYFKETRSSEIVLGNVTVYEDLTALDVAIHPRHAQHIRPHQLEGFHFLVKNLVCDKPGGCILAHAAGSGKTFMIICFIQSFLAKHPSARPLVVLPKGIVGTWKREFQRWQVEDIPLYDFYSVNATKREDQLKILYSWQSNMSILFLGYEQFSKIICFNGDEIAGAACRDMLLMAPNLLIMDEGHTPRNKETNLQDSLSQVQTPRKVVMSGTLFQNHVKEVVSILNLVRPKFLNTGSTRPIARRSMSQVAISGKKIPKDPRKFDKVFAESVEETLLHDVNFTRKKHVIRSLRELTEGVIHYYKGDILHELPGLIDFSVFLKLSPMQKESIQKLEAYEYLKSSAVGTALYVHPCLFEMSEAGAADRAKNLTDATVDTLVESVQLSDGVKANFFINILKLASSAGEKLLAFSQHILPMKFLERLLVNMFGWRVGKEIFAITGDTSAADRELAMDKFNNSADSKVLFGSIKACGEGISLVGASRVVILDVHLNPSVTRQAIGRAFRPGQKKKVFVYRLVAADSPEENFHEIALRKEGIAKLMFEWNGRQCTAENFELNRVYISNCQDEFLHNNAMRWDIKALYTR
ncbi:protein CHROMATIN REMODELING 35 [Brachypodium distachyon]|uniref:protein CHROMATIN REMODELING 35 n=1 Tax=Brachypodium distachyon TaxID=15368 RepID=UPI000D0CD325|nr:protein CHROMATIN REMODELING 35 [Brachypodium distachyon]|eukprot:XP_024314539.1 protein CHROMATIN REMODELING 35 [Brachypodium distachyon]